MFPRIDHQITPEKQYIIKKFLVKELKLELDKDKCRNCGVCLTVCPNNVISRGAPGASIKSTLDQEVPGVVLDPEACSYCGACSYFCPFDALKLIIDGETVPKEELILVEKEALPKLIEKEVTLKDGKIGRQYMEGHLEYSEDACQSGCRTCVNICPTGTLKFEKREPWEIGEKFVIDREKCIYCGACAFSCPSGAIKIFRDKINHEGKYKEPFWPNMEKKLLDFHGSFD
ncbi:MAG: 4Fe-4S binding protein [Promethearchaeota archaeon]